MQVMEENIVLLRVNEAKAVLSIEHLTRAVEILTVTVGELRDTMNYGRGALYAVGAGAALVGGAASYAAGKLFGG
jgi:hypothetical protein